MMYEDEPEVIINFEDLRIANVSSEYMKSHTLLSLNTTATSLTLNMGEECLSFKVFLETYKNRLTWVIYSKDDNIPRIGYWNGLKLLQSNKGLGVNMNKIKGIISIEIK